MVLVTGVAGFVGSHVALELVRQWGARVVGLDNFNDYYDVQLKKVGLAEGLLLSDVHKLNAVRGTFLLSLRTEPVSW